MKTLEGWERSGVDFDHYCKAGDAVEDALVDYFTDILPPRTLTGLMVQVGEPYDHLEDEQGRLRATYGTFARRGGQ